MSLVAIARSVRSLWERAEPVVTKITVPLAVVTPLGRAVILVALVVTAVGWWLGWAEFVAAGVVSALSIVVAGGFILGRPDYQIRVDLASLRVVVGDRATGGITVRGGGSRSIAPALIELPVGAAVAAFLVPRLDPGEEHDESFTIPTQRRAVLSLGPVRSVRRDPLELLRRQVGWTEPQEIFVHPRTIRLDSSSTGFIRDLEGMTTRELSNDDVSFHALREYVPGDDLRYVHWRSTARTGQVMIRQFEETRRSQFVIVLATRNDDYADEDEFELAVSVAASLSRSAQVEGKEVTVFTTEGRLSGPTPQRLLDSYSRIQPVTRGPELSERVRVVAAETPGASVVALISGSLTPVEDIRLASIRVPVMARSLTVRVAPTEQISRRAVRDFELLTLPGLDDLPRAIRAVTR